MGENNVTINFSNIGTRNEVRMRVIHEFSKEIPGNGSGSKASRYTYYVEELACGNRVYLRRPANLHNGFDFLVCVEGYNFAENGKRSRNFPKHEDIMNDLREKANQSRALYERLFGVLEKIYLCQDVEFNSEKFVFEIGYPVDLLVKTVKWLFVEQDIRYWNYSGRDMLWNGIKSI